MYALHLSDDRILSCTFAKYAPNHYPIVDSIPDGNVTDYLYKNGQYIYAPLPQPEPEPAQPTLEDRVKTLETVTDDVVLLMAELIGGN